MKPVKAFSLIELLIVMAIVGVLAAIAVPAYKAYTNKVTVNNTMKTTFYHYKDLSIQYFEKNGIFPTGQQLDPINGSGADINFTGNQTINRIRFIPFPENSGVCAVNGMYGTMQIANSTLDISYYLVYKDNLFTTYCIYEISSDSGLSLTNCVDAAEPEANDVFDEVNAACP